MRPRLFALSVISAACLIAAAPHPQSVNYKVSIRVFEIPPIQSVTSGGSSGSGAVTGTTVGGLVTGRFPGQPIVIPTGLAANARDEDLKNVLYDGGYLVRSCLPTGVYWADSGEYSISLAWPDIGTESCRREYHEPAVTATWENLYVPRAEYWLTMTPVAASDVDILLRIEFTGTAGTALFDGRLSIPLGRTTLIGFRALAQRGVVYVLAVSVERQDAAVAGTD